MPDFSSQHRRPQATRRRRPDTDEEPEVMTLNWHIRKFAQQQKAWQSYQREEERRSGEREASTIPFTRPSTIPVNANKPLPALPALKTREQYLNEEFVPVLGYTQPLPGSGQPQHGSENLGGGLPNHQYGSQANQDYSNMGNNRHQKFHTDDKNNLGGRTHRASDLPPSLVAGRNTNERTHRNQSKPEVGERGILGVPLSVYDFRGTLPEELQPKGPPLRWDSEPAPHVSLMLQRDPTLLEDGELARFRPTGRVGAKAVQGKTPLLGASDRRGAAADSLVKMK